MVRLAIAILVGGSCLAGLAGRLDRADARAAPADVEPAPRVEPRIEPPPPPMVRSARDRAAGIAVADRRHRGTAH